MTSTEHMVHTFSRPGACDISSPGGRFLVLAMMLHYGLEITDRRTLMNNFEKTPCIFQGIKTDSQCYSSSLDIGRPENTFSQPFKAIKVTKEGRTVKYELCKEALYDTSGSFLWLHAVLFHLGYILYGHNILPLDLQELLKEEDYTEHSLKDNKLVREFLGAMRGGQRPDRDWTAVYFALWGFQGPMSQALLLRQMPVGSALGNTNLVIPQEFLYHNHPRVWISFSYYYDGNTLPEHIYFRALPQFCFMNFKESCGFDINKFNNSPSYFKILRLIWEFIKTVTGEEICSLEDLGFGNLEEDKDSCTLITNNFERNFNISPILDTYYSRSQV